MALTTKKVVGWLQARLAEIDSQLAALQEERAYLKGATTGLYRGAKRKATIKELTKGKKKSLSAGARKKIGVARKKAWADVHKLVKAGKIAKADLASRAAYYKAHPKEA